MRFDRRIFLAGLMALGVLGGAASTASAQQVYSVMDLSVAGPLGDKILGDPNAPVTVIEYASMTCPHCGRFATEVFPQVKAKYIDTGKIKYIFREYPLDALAAVGAMVARCAPDDQYFALIDLMFEHQQEWAYVQNPLPALFNLVKQTGFTQQSFDACTKNQKVLDAVQASLNRGKQKFGVDGTPTFFINGVKYSGEQEMSVFDKAVAQAGK